jgi:arabinogalactan oligomer / maltooligosaccharide transport system permease protein
MGGMSSQTRTVPSIILRLSALLVVNAIGMWLFIYTFIDGLYPLASVFAIILVFVNVVFLKDGLYPLRWLALGLSVMLLMSIFPIVYTIYIAFTNFGTGHIFTRQQAIDQLENTLYLPEGGPSYSYTAFVDSDGQYALWLQLEDAADILAIPGEPLVAPLPGEMGVGPFDEAGIPTTIEGYRRLQRGQLLARINDLTRIQFGEEPDIIRVRSIDAAAPMQQRYMYDLERDVMVDRSTGIEYTPQRGTFTGPDGQQLRPGYQVLIGGDNFTRFFRSPAIRGPLVRVIIWNFAFAFLSVFTTFFLGLFVALLVNDLPMNKVLRSFLIIPYTIPSLITILVWRGMLNPQLGVISRGLIDVFGSAPQWFTDPNFAKIGILLINLWLGYPYFFLVCSGALQAIPRDIYSAAEVDGAGNWQQFWRLTLPLLLIAVGPLLVASFAFNFNNFNVIFLFNGGGPPIAGAATPVGHTDILVTYVYQLAFAGGRGADYGLASAITIIIFIIVATITLFQFRYTQMWEETSENV